MNADAAARLMVERFESRPAVIDFPLPTRLGAGSASDAAALRALADHQAIGVEVAFLSLGSSEQPRSCSLAPQGLANSNRMGLVSAEMPGREASCRPRCRSSSRIDQGAESTEMSTELGPVMRYCRRDLKRRSSITHANRPSRTTHVDLDALRHGLAQRGTTLLHSSRRR
jgi:hypothetical protein